MPWKCPACSTQIVHAVTELQPIAGIVYRCHVCRLELTIDSTTGKLALVPLPTTDPPKSRKSL